MNQRHLFQSVCVAKADECAKRIIALDERIAKASVKGADGPAKADAIERHQLRERLRVLENLFEGFGDADACQE